MARCPQAPPCSGCKLTRSWPTLAVGVGLCCALLTSPYSGQFWLESSPSAPPVGAFLDTSGVDFSAPPFVPAPHCANVILPATNAHGLGHRMTLFFIAVAQAASAGAAIAVSPKLMQWSIPRLDKRSGKTSLEFLPELFGLGRFAVGLNVTEELTESGVHETPWGALTTSRSFQVSIDTAKVLALQSTVRASCGYAFPLHASFGFGWIKAGDALVAGTFQRLRPLIVALHASVPAGREQIDLPLYRPVMRAGLLTVAWHVREGDISLVRPVAQTYAALARALSGTPVRAHHFVFSENPIYNCSESSGGRGSGSGAGETSGAPWCPAPAPGDTAAPVGNTTRCVPSAYFSLRRDVLPQDSCFYTVSLRTAVLHLAGADVVYYSGSSLVSIAATLALRDDQVRLHGPDKDGPITTSLYFLNGSIALLSNGSVAAEDEPLLLRRIKTRQRNNAELYRLRQHS